MMPAIERLRRLRHRRPGSGALGRRRLAWRILVLAVALLPGGGAAGEASASDPASPPRGRCTPDPGHVECLDDHAGLIHGAVIHTPGFRLGCRAFRQLWMLRYQGKRSRAETREVVVAGVCEQTTPAGELIRRWSSADPLPITKLDRTAWSSLEVEPPPPVVRLVSHRGGSRKSWIWTGYYLPKSWDGRTFLDASAPADFNPWPPLGRTQAWAQEPPAGESVESPLFDRPVSCTSGFVVCSPYLSILHPDPAGSEVRVGMVSARRFFSFRTGHGMTYEHDATILHEVFSNPDAGRNRP